MNVYLIHATGTNRYKIGITSRTIESRLNELNGSQSAYPLELIASIRNANYKAVERHLHEKYAVYRVHGEWFQFDLGKLAEVQRCIQELDTPIEKIKPIFKTRPQATSPRIPWKEWLFPLLLGVGIVSACHSLEFFESPAKQPHSQKVLQIPKQIRRHQSSRVRG